MRSFTVHLPTLLPIMSLYSNTWFFVSQGLGLYAAKDLEMHTIVIEYIGDLIRNEVANRREKFYEAQVSQLCQKSFYVR